ncbi:MAG: hypothetical protein OXI47_06760 [Gammaproteobacteria bacterium]|nr:hypothetical protein [Gammaproteobacteria bacterium]
MARMESGRVPPSMRTLEKVAQATIRTSEKCAISS